ncbi:discoidin domain-containing protein [Anaerobium acetethylicum]|uniref:Hexosaminidase n=1 Tax=Anaerobium acetethylicum TaxID=1619234 RepID=A0A1D3TXE8_9FIRM|nr:discoidin domain-containing protein [Anaerobium acetethylicum]SCP98986.1 hexosaminidase [Anaerobium acetethylicum]
MKTKRILSLILACVMVFTMVPFSGPDYVNAAAITTNLALQGTATASDSEASTLGAANAVDGVVNYDANSGQSRWASNTTSASETSPKWLQVDLGSVQTFQSLEIEWERKNASAYKVQISNDASSWTDVYTAASAPAGYRETIRLSAEATARYVRLYITAYGSNAPKRGADGSDVAVNWNTVSVFEFRVLQTVENTNLALAATATASGAEAATLAAGKAADGAAATRWASEARQASAANPHWLQLDLGTSKTISSFAILWERTNATGYCVEVSDDAQTWSPVFSATSQPAMHQQQVNLAAAVQARYIRVRIDTFNSTGVNAAGTSVTWNTVSIYEFEVYGHPLDIQTETLESVAAGIEVPAISAGDTKMQMPEVPDGFEIEFIGADYEQIIGRDLTIYTPIVDKTVSVNFKITKGTESKETNAIAVPVPGNAGITVPENANPEPAVVPELAEWKGSTGNFTISDTSKIVINAAYNAELAKTAEEFKADYEDVTGRTIEIVSGSEADAAAGDFYFTLGAPASEGLMKEGYIAEIGDSVKVRAEDPTGAYWSTRTILQILKQNVTTIPKGITRDYPKFEIRGFIIDVGRKTVELETLKEIAKNMAWYKLNDLQVHLNDCLIFLEDYITIENAYNAYSGFRLESGIKNSEGVGITSTDTYYTKDEFRSFIKDSRDIGVNIIPEIDAPAHALAITKVFPELALESFSGRRPLIDHLNLSNPESIELVKDIFSDYTDGSDPVFDSETTVHIGADEYMANAEQYRAFTDEMLRYIQEDKDRTVRMWGSLTMLKGTTPVRSENVQIDLWNNGWANPQEMYEKGYDLINTQDGTLYMVPAAGYYYDYLNAQSLYSNWKPNVVGNFTLPAGSDQMLGAAYALWNDSIDTRANGISEYDIFDRFFNALPALSEKMWGEGKDKTYAELTQVVAKTATAPNTNPFDKVESIGSEYLNYSFDDAEITDASGNGYDAVSRKNVTQVNGKEGNAIRLAGAESYVETPVKKVGPVNAVSFWIKKDGTSTQEEQIIFESSTKFDNYAIKAVQKETGKVGFSREGYDYSFDYTLPNDTWVHLTIRGMKDKAELYVNNELVSAIGSTAGAQMHTTLVLPIERIGSKTNAFTGLIDEVSVTNGAIPADPSLIPTEGFTITCDNQNAAVSGKEGPAAYAFDGNESTWWHSNYSPKDDLPATIEIDMNAVYNINKFTYVPRTDGNLNGCITSYKLYVRKNASDEWTAITENGTWENSSATKDIKFDAAEARYIKFVAVAGGSGFASASEFKINKVTAAAVTGISLNQTEAVLTGIGSELQLSAEVTPDQASDAAITWETTDAAVAAVDGSGKVTATGEGTVTITARAGDQTASCTVTVQTTPQEKINGFVNRLYDKVLDRTAAAEEIDYYASSLAKKEKTGADVGYGFIFSEEFTNRELGNEAYVEVLYETFMGRASDAGGKAYWINFLENGVSRKYVFKGFVESPEYKDICASSGIDNGTVNLPAAADQNADLTMFVCRLYEKALDRRAESDGLEYHTANILAERVTPVQAAQDFIFSPEFKNRKLSDSDYVKVLYRTFMGREFDQGGLEYHMSRLENGTGREEILLGFAFSPEFKGIIEGFGLK